MEKCLFRGIIGVDSVRKLPDSMCNNQLVKSDSSSLGDLVFLGRPE